MATSILLDKNLNGDIKVLSLDDKFLFYTNLKKANWYLSRNLAEWIDDMTLKLNFKTKGDGYSQTDCDFGRNPINNQCVCCASEELLTKHHIVPYAFRKFLPMEYKDHNMHDVVFLCRNCHDKYEILAQQYRDELFHHYGIDQIIEQKNEYWRKVVSNCRVIHCKYADLIPQNVKDEAKLRIEEFLNRKITDDEIKDLSVIERNFYNPFEDLISKLQNYQEFILDWRKHFLNEMKPQFMPAGWDLNYDEYLLRYI